MLIKKECVKHTSSLNIQFCSNWYELSEEIRIASTRYVRAKICKYLLNITQFCIFLRRKRNHVLKNSWKKVICVSRWCSFNDTAIMLISIFGKNEIKWIKLILINNVAVTRGVSVSVIKYIMAPFCKEWRRSTLW